MRPYGADAPTPRRAKRPSLRNFGRLLGAAAFAWAFCFAPAVKALPTNGIKAPFCLVQPKAKARHVFAPEDIAIDCASSYKNVVFREVRPKFLVEDIFR